jgi:enterochelin esterase-like enzyme
MRRGALAFGLAALCAASARAADPPPLPSVASGRIERIEALPSQHVAPRPIDVWLPVGYPAQAPYAVLYLQDGQMLFDGATTWNGQEWRVDEVAGELLREERLRPFIVVGIWNGGAARTQEYFPQRALETMGLDARAALLAERREGAALFVAPPRGDAYLAYLVDEVVPYVESHYAVSPRREDRFIGGSSRGALLALYALLEHPDRFGGALCLSTHWPLGAAFDVDHPVPAGLRRYVEQALPPPGEHRLWFDHGDATLDAAYAPHQQAIDALLQARGWTRSRWQSRVYADAAHDEAAWAARLDQPLLFLLRK